MSFETGASKHPLIVAHAQHPLVEGQYPGEEFAARLDVAAELYDHQPGATIYVPGSRHRSGRHHDSLSLSESGINYLLGQGLPENALHGDDWNEQFKPGRGVYSAGDEVYVATRAYKEFAFESLMAVCARGQRRRLALHYAAYSVSPAFHMPRTQVDTHQGLSETVLIAYTQFANPTWQTGSIPKLIRASRLPRS